MISHTIYNRYSDNLAKTAASVTLGAGTLATGYDLEWIRDNSAARGVRLNEKQASIVYHWSSPVAVAIVALLHCNYAEGSVVYIQGNATNSWGSPSFSTTITVSAWKKGRMPAQDYKDLTTLSGWGSYAYWRIATISDNAVALFLGEYWLGSAVRTFNLQWSERPTIDRPQVERKTAYRTLRIPLGTTRRSISSKVPGNSDSMRDLIRDWILDADGRATLFIPKHADTTDAWHAIHTTTLQEFNQIENDVIEYSLVMEEDGRGLEPTPTPLA